MADNVIDETGDLARISGYQREYLDFLDDEEDQGTYANLVLKMVTENQTRLIVNINDLRKKNPQRATFLLKNAFEEQLAFQKALKDYIATVDHSYSKHVDEFHVGFEGTFGSNHVTPRTLNSRFLGQLVCVEGIVTKCSLIHPKIVKSVHYCPTTGKFLERKYTDLTSFDAFPAVNSYPTKDADGNLLETEYGFSTYKDHQTLSIQEMPEKAPAGQLPRGLDVILDDDLVDKSKPGDRIQLVGSYRCLPSKKGAYTTCTFRTILVACNIILLSKEHSEEVSSEDVVNCKKIAKSKQYGNVFDLLARSIAPSIHGHEYAKKAILCMLLGGNEKVLPNGTRLRGDINVLLIGDPGVAKSQLLRYVLWAAPRAVAATGRSSTAVGLTAAVTHDQETGERRLEAGAMVLADRGIICIDEFDKMTDADRTAIHEVMEQGRVTIAKAGIHARLNARCSVLAAANPVYGRYDQYKTPMENIGLQDSLLSRFDLLFVMLDTADKETDGYISDHVVRTHRYRKPGEEEGYVLPMGATVDLRSTYQPEQNENEDDGEGNVFEKYDALLHGNSRTKNDNIISVSFMRKYLQIAKLLKPKLTDEACQMISEQYVSLRSIEEGQMEGGVARTLPVTTRTLETLIRLSTAHAKARMSPKVQAKDVQMAIELVQYAHFKKVLPKEKKRRRGQSGDEEEEEESEPPTRRTRSSAPETQEETQSQEQQVETQDLIAISEETPMEMEELDETVGTVTDERLAIFRDQLSKAFMEAHTQTLPISKVEEALKDVTPHFEKPEIRAALNKMQDENQVMVAQDNVFLI